MQNICFFNSTSFWGGGEKAHLEYAINFGERYTTCIFTNKGSVLEKRAKACMIDTISIKAGNLSFLNPLKIRKIAHKLKEKEIDTIFLNSSPDLKLGGLAAKRAGVKNIVYMRGLAVPVKNSSINRFYFKSVVTHTVPNSLDTRRTFLTHLRPALNEENVPVIYRGINFKAWDQRKINDFKIRDGDEIILGNVGRLVEQKGQKYLIEIANILVKNELNFKLIIAGSGPLENELTQLIERNNLNDRVILAGFQSDIKSFLNAIDIFVFPSLWEGFGNAMVEAMAEKKAPVAFKLTSNPEIIEDGRNGLLVEFPDIERFAKCIVYLANNPQIRKELGVNARKSVIENFSFDKILDEWEKLLG